MEATRYDFYANVFCLLLWVFYKEKSINLEDMACAPVKRYLWFDAFNKNWHHIKALGFDETLRRKWNYYLCYCDAAFNMNNINVMPMVYTHPNNLNWE